MAADSQVDLRAYLEYFRDLGVYDFYRNGEPSDWWRLRLRRLKSLQRSCRRRRLHPLFRSLIFPS